MPFRARVRRRRNGQYEVRLEPWERDLLRTLPAQLRELLDSDDPALERLYPPAYLDDDEKNAEYTRLMRDDLTRRRLSSLEVMEATVDAETLDEEQVLAWLGALNDLRLVLGTRLDVSDDPDYEVPEDDPSFPAFALYSYLGVLEDTIVHALSSGL